MKQLFQLIPLLLVLFDTSAMMAQDTQIFDNYQQILPRGRIAAVFEPLYVEADSARINEHTWVLGIIIAEQPRAYSLNLLNHHEIVNDVIDTTHFAAVW